MKYGLYAINYATCADPEIAVQIAQHAEAAGFESVWAGEHIVLPDPKPDWFTMEPDLPFLDVVVALTLLAANTTSLTIGASVMQLPLHQPVLLAKQLASIDRVANGRLVAGFGAGYLEAEFAALGVSLAERGSLMEEYIAAMRALWAMPKPSFAGRHVSFAGIDAQPRATRPQGPPIVLGGLSDAARRRAVRLADGWFAYDATIEWAGDVIATLAREVDELERPEELGRLELTMIPAGQFDRGVAERYAELGVDRLVMLPEPEAEQVRQHEMVPVDEIRRTIDALATELRL